MARDAALEAVFQPVRPPTTFEETVERLGTAIRLGLLAPGSKLPPERELAGELRISRSTLREALTTLTQSGHLIAQRGRSGGTFVAEAPPLAELESEPLGQGTWSVLEHRVAIETGATILACERAEAPDLERLDELVEKMAEAGDFDKVDPSETAEVIMRSAVCFTHPMMVGQCMEEGEDLEAEVRKFIRFQLRALTPR